MESRALALAAPDFPAPSTKHDGADCYGQNVLGSVVCLADAEDLGRPIDRHVGVREDGRRQTQI